jgi:MoxR-like ATPase
MNRSDNPFVNIRANDVTELPANGRFAAAGHLWSQPEIDALILAHAARRPLLVRGEPGSGKSQIARAAAVKMGDAPLLVEVIHPRFEALDLLYRLDAVERLADAQIPGQLDRSNEKYVKRGRLWEAFKLMGKSNAMPVLLIDEIDKADADVPNALLDVLGNRSFDVPPLGQTVKAEGGGLPLIIITTNEERELPAAFVRRCAVLNVNPPKEDKEEPLFVEWLVERGRVHGHLEISEEARRQAAQQVLADRKAAIEEGYPKVGLAEYIDLLTALYELTQGSPKKQRAVEQIEWLTRLSAYALIKNAEQDQSRGRKRLASSAENPEEKPSP